MYPLYVIYFGSKKLWRSETQEKNWISTSIWQIGVLFQAGDEGREDEAYYMNEKQIKIRKLWSEKTFWCIILTVKINQQTALNSNFLISNHCRCIHITQEKQMFTADPDCNGRAAHDRFSRENNFEELTNVASSGA